MATFKSYAQGGGFKPIQAPDVASMVEAKAKKQSDYMRQAAKYNIDERQRIGGFIEINNDLEFRNRQQRFDFETKNLEAIQNQVMGNYEATISNAQSQSQAQIDTLKAISNISQTAFETVQAVNQKIETGRKLAVEKTLYATGITTKELMEIHKLGRNLSDQDYQENSAIRAIVDRTGASIQQIRYLRENSNAKLWNESMALVDGLATGYRTEVTGKYNTKYNLGDGRQLSLAETEGRDLGAYNQIMSQIRSEYVANSGMLNLSSAIIGAKIHPLMRSVEAELTQQSNTKYRALSKQEAEDNIYKNIKTDVDTYGADGIDQKLKSLSGAARTAYLNDLRTFFKREASGPRRGDYQSVYQRLLELPTEFNGQQVTYGDILTSPADQEVADAFIKARQRDHAALALDERDKQRDRDAVEEAFIERLKQMPGGFSMADAQAVIAEFGERFPGYTSTKLEVMMRNQSADALEVQRQMREAEDLRSRGLLTTEYMEEQGYHSSVISQYQRFAAAASESRKANGNYKTQLEALAKLAASPPEVKDALNETKWTVPLKAQQLQTKFLAKVAELQAAGDPNAVANAFNYVRQDFSNEVQNKEIFNPAGGGYAEFIRGPASGAKAAAARFQHINGMIDSLGVKALDRNGAIYSISELKSIEEEMKKPGYKMDPMAEYLSGRFGPSVTPLNIINRQRRAAGFEAIIPPSVSKFRTQADPKLLKFLDQYQTPEASTRAMISTRQFDATRVPKGYGPLVVQAAQTAGVAPNYIAALAEIESSWDPNAKSKVGAIGLMQIYPPYHPQYTGGKDPQANLNYGASYYAQLLKKYGDPVKAVGAYNAGPGRFDEYLTQGRPLPKETINHMANFSIALAKYGDVSQLRSTTTMRNTFAVRQYVSGDPAIQGMNTGSVIYDPVGHGGQAYHNHYEFATKQQAMEAKKLYESKGYRVTSYIRPGDPGAHGKGYAIDVAPPLDLPYSKEAEARWSAEANAVIGYNPLQR